MVNSGALPRTRTRTRRRRGRGRLTIKITIKNKIKIRRDSLTYAEGDSGDEVAAEAVLEAVEDFFAAVTDDLAEPDAAVHGHEEGALAQAGGLGVDSSVWLSEIVRYRRKEIL